MENTAVENLYSEELYQIPGKITIVITVPWARLSDEDKVQLTRITDVLRHKINPKLNLEAFRVVHVPSLDLSTWSEKPSTLIYFGSAMKGLPNYEVIEAEGTKMVLAESLSDLLTNDTAKTKLWQALKLLF